MNRSTHHALVCAAAAAILAGCGNHARHISDLPEPLSSPPFKVPSTPAEVQREEFSKAAVDLQSALQGMEIKQGHGVNEQQPVPPFPADKPQSRARDRSPASPAAMELAANEPIVLPDAQSASRSGPKPKSLKGGGASDDRTPAQRKQDAITQLASQLKPGIDGARLPIRAAMPLLGLETISPGAAAGELDAVMRAVTPDQRKTVGVARDLFHALSTDPDLASGEPAALARVLREKSDQLAPASSPDGFGLGSVVLCQRVDGFGRFVPLGECTFIAGRPAAMIVYTEVENFSQSRSTEVGPFGPESIEKWRVELGQSVRLYLDSDGSEQLTLPESMVRDQSISRRHDFFLVQRLDLPRNLSVGNYNLKVAVRDISGGSLAERIIPVRIVADPSAMPQSAGSANPRQIGKLEGNGRFAGNGK